MLVIKNLNNYFKLFVINNYVTLYLEIVPALNTNIVYKYHLAKLKKINKITQLL